MSLDQRVRTMQQPEAAKLVRGIYSGMVERVTSNSTYGARMVIHDARGLVWIWPSKRFQEQAQSESETTISLLNQLEGQKHGQNVQKATEYLSSVIKTAVEFYPGDEKRLETLQQYLEGSLESTVALIEGHKNGLHEDATRFIMRRFWGYSAVGVFAGYVVKRELWDGFVRAITPSNINQDFLTTAIETSFYFLPVLVGFLVGSTIAMVRSSYYKEEANMRFGEQLEVFKMDALHTFTSSS